MANKLAGKKLKKAIDDSRGLTLYRRYKLYGIKYETWKQLPEFARIILLDVNYTFSNADNSGIVYTVAVEFARLGVPRKILWHFLLGWVTNARQRAKLKITLNYAYGQVKREQRGTADITPDTYAEELKKPELTEEQLQLLLTARRIIAFHGGDVFETSYAELAALTGMLQANVVYYVKVLIERGYIERLHTGRGNQLSKYRFLPKTQDVVEAQLPPVVELLKTC